MTQASKVEVSLGKRSYDILIGPGLLGESGKLIAPFLTRRRAFVITDESVAKFHLPSLERALEAEGIAPHTLVLPAGEATKSFENLSKICDELLSHRLERGDLILALGGGVIGDLAGFAASVLLRGIDFIQIPTTLLAQVDSSVGGKTAINSPQGKNLIGAFHQPRLVIADTNVLSTLPKRELLAGYAEVVKYGLINDPEFFGWLEGHGHQVTAGEPEALSHAIATSCRAKAAIVAQDEEERGARALLNLGHTFGHALEAECGYSDELLHGEAVAIGMILAFELSAQMGLCDAGEVDRIRRHFIALDLPSDFQRLRQRAWSARRLVEHMGHDKKVQAGRMTFILAKGIGKAFITQDVDRLDVERLLREEIMQTARQAG